MSQLRYATGHSWHAVSTKPAGGFFFLHQQCLKNVRQARTSQAIRSLDVRIWFAVAEMLARRCLLPTNRRPGYGEAELAKLLGLRDVKPVRAGLARLRAAGLLEWRSDEVMLCPAITGSSRGRPIPFPRRLLRLIAKSRGEAFIATIAAHCERCLFYRSGEVRSGGWCKASWVVAEFGVSLRAVKSARSRLASEGLIEVLDANQQRLNRFGLPVVIRLDWADESAPPRPAVGGESAPPRKHKQLSYRRVKNQKPAGPADRSGACKQAPSPSLRDVRLADLENPFRTAKLFEQAVGRRLAKRNQAELLRVFAAAAHARRVGSTNPGGLFVWQLKNRRLDYLSQDDEETGRREMNRLISVVRHAGCQGAKGQRGRAT